MVEDHHVGVGVSGVVGGLVSVFMVWLVFVSDVGGVCICAGMRVYVAGRVCAYMCICVCFSVCRWVFG